MPEVTVWDTTTIRDFAGKVRDLTGMHVTEFDLEYNGTTLRKKEDYETTHVRDYKLTDGCIVDVVILTEPRKEHTVVPKDQKFSLDFRFENGSVIEIGDFHLGTAGSTFCRTANRELSAKFPELNFEADYFNGDAKKKIPSSNVHISDRGVTAESTIRVKLAKNCKDQVLAALEDGFQAELPEAKFASVKELVEHHRSDLFKPREYMPKAVNVIYGVVVKELVDKANMCSDRLASLIYTGTVSADLETLIAALKARFEECCRRMKLKPEDFGLVILFSSEQLAEFPIESPDYAMEVVELAIGDIFENAKDEGFVIFHEKFANGTGCSSSNNGNYFLSRKLLLMTHGERILEVIDESIKQVEYVRW